MDHLLASLGWVNLDFESSTVCPIPPQLMGQKWLGKRTRWWNAEIEVDQTQVREQVVHPVHPWASKFMYLHMALTTRRNSSSNSLSDSEPPSYDATPVRIGVFTGDDAEAVSRSPFTRTCRNQVHCLNEFHHNSSSKSIHVFPPHRPTPRAPRRGLRPSALSNSWHK